MTLNTLLYLVMTAEPTASPVSPADSARIALRQTAEAIANDPNAFLVNLLQDAIAFGLKVLAAMVIYAAGAWFIRRVKNFLSRIFTRKKTEPTLATFISSLATISLTVLLIIITISTLGVNTTSLAAVLAAGGMAIGMALSGTVQNFAGGIMLLLFKPFKVGDYIIAQGYEGKVTELTIVSTKIKTYDNSEIILPNGSLSNGTINNFSVIPVHRVKICVDVEYGSDIQKARELLLEIARSDARVLDATEKLASDPSVNIEEMKESSIQLALKVWTKVDDYWGVKYSLTEQVYRELPANGINFPFPQLTVHVKDSK